MLWLQNNDYLNKAIWKYINNLVSEHQWLLISQKEKPPEIILFCMLGTKYYLWCVFLAEKKKEAKETWIKLNLPFNLQFTGHKEQENTLYKVTEIQSTNCRNEKHDRTNEKNSSIIMLQAYTASV